MPIVVYLPAPFGPKSAKKSPCLISKSIPSNALCPLEYVLVKLFISNADESMIIYFPKGLYNKLLMTL